MEHPVTIVRAPRAVPVDLELVLSHDARNWHAEGAQLSLSAPSLTELEALIAAAARSRLGADRPQRVALRFDLARIPAWLRQYQAHYFNYTLLVEGR
jgi:hypothetical protein